MKKFLRPLALAVAFVLLAAGSYAAVSGDGPVSLSYLVGTFMPQAVRAGNDVANEALEDTYDTAKSTLDQVHSQVSGGAAVTSGQHSSTLQRREWYDSQRICLGTGSGALLLEGYAVVSHNGAVVDVTTGTEVASGTALSANHRYLVGENTTAYVTIQSGYAAMGVQGSYTVDGGNKDAAPFLDVKQSDWYYAPVNYVYEKKLFSGMSEHTFGPKEPMTRAMLTTVLYQLAGAPAGEMASADVTLTDVPASAWYAPYVKWAVSQGVTAGTGNGTFSPNMQVTREQVVVMLYSFAANYLGMDMDRGADLSGYQDRDKVSSWALEAMSWAVGQGVVSGANNGGVLTLNPQYNANRAEVATMLRSFAEKIS